MPGMDLVRAKDVEEQQDRLTEAVTVSEMYSTGDTEFDKKVRLAADELKRAFEMDLTGDEKVIDLFSTVSRGWSKAEMYGTPPDYPRIAVVNAKFATKLVTCRSYKDGSAKIGNRGNWVELPAGTDPNPSQRDRVTEAVTQAPPIPPQFRHLVKPDTLLMWEVEGWTHDKKHRPPPPVDPALLQRIGDYGSLYTVVAEWDLTELERMVMVHI